MRRLLALVAAAFVVATAVSPAMAGRRWQDSTQEIGTYTQGPCNDGVTVLHQSGHTNSSPNYSRSGVKATLDLSSGFDLCTNAPGSDGNVNAFIAVQPYDMPSSVYLRLGVVECRDPWAEEILPAVCQGENSPQYYYGYNTTGCVGCYQVFKIGPADYSAHILAIYFQTDGKWYWTIDGAVVFSRSAGLMPWSNPLNNNLRVAWGTTQREFGDSVGDPSAASWFTGARYGRYNIGWIIPGWVSGSQCQFEDWLHECSFTANDAMKFYTP